MPYVITEPCADSRDTSCVDVCPVDAIHPTPDEGNFDDSGQLYIDPLGCIECGACAPVCPVNAIFAHHEVPDRWTDYIAANADRFRSGSADEERDEFG